MAGRGEVTDRALARIEPLLPVSRCTGSIEDLAVEGAGLGRSRDGLSTKIHLAVDGRGLPMRVILTGGHAGDNPHLLPLLDNIQVGRIGPGRPRCRPEAVIADKAYSHPSTRQALRARHITFVRPERDDQIARRAAYYHAELTVAAIILWLR